MSNPSPREALFGGLNNLFGVDAPNYRPQLEAALSHAVPYTDQEDAEQAAADAHRFAGLPDSEVLVSSFVAGPDEVAVTGLADYMHLLAQAFQVTIGANGKRRPTISELMLSGVVMDNLRHESDHALPLFVYGNSQTAANLGVKLIAKKVAGRKLYNVVPFMATSGPLAKIHHGYSALSPKDRSPTDLVIARMMDCDPQDFAEVERRAKAVPSVPEGWNRVHDLLVPKTTA